MLEDLWYGNIVPFESFLDGRQDYHEMMKVMAGDRDRLEKDLTPKQRDLLAKCDDVISEMHSIAEAEAFKFGFRLALNLTVESLR